MWRVISIKKSRKMRDNTIKSFGWEITGGKIKPAPPYKTRESIYR